MPPPVWLLPPPISLPCFGKNGAHFYDRLFLAGQGGDVAGWPQSHKLVFFDGGGVAIYEEPEGSEER